MKCKQKLCSRSKNLSPNGNCSVCEEVLENARIAKDQTNKQKSVPKIEVDLKQMIDVHGKLSKGANIDPSVVSGLLLAGVINILGQHDELEQLEERIKALECNNLTNRNRIEALENWVVKQDELITVLDGKLSTMDQSGVIIKEGIELKEIKKRIVSL